MRSLIFAANWKMHVGPPEAREYLRAFFAAGEIPLSQLRDQIAALNPSELIVEKRDVEKVRSMLGDRYKVPRHIAEAIEDSPEFRREVAELAARLELPEEEVTLAASCLLLRQPIPLDVPVRLLHGLADASVPWQLSLRVAERLQSRDVVVTLVKDGDHRLSSEADLARLARILDGLLAA